MRTVLLNCLLHAAQADVDLTNTVRPLASFRAHFTDCSTCSLDQVLDSCQDFPSTDDRAMACLDLVGGIGDQRFALVGGDDSSPLYGKSRFRNRPLTETIN